MADWSVTEQKASGSQPTPSKNQIIEMYRKLNNELRQVQERVFHLQNQAEEHELVANIIEPLPGDRKCCRLVSGVLVERTVAQVLPVIRENAKNLQNVRLASLTHASCIASAMDAGAQDSQVAADWV
jgi:prefoldin subunit 2